ncbi:LysR family transcriptional regulator [Maricurvus nonylphenolicus]|uniref:LysR family transcriptional regulator n=1 Tax=Maricurvus nonylphenolicus TaxID=1008307 RepID=UPI0036F43F49
MSKFAQFEAFIATVSTGSISLAAESLNRTPSAISKQITNLESSLGVQLFDRSNKRMAVTKQGGQFFRTCSSILKQIKEAESQLLLESAAIFGDIKITLSKSLIGSELMEHLNDFAETYPHTKYDLRFTENVENFSEADLDFAFRIGSISDQTRLIARELMEVTPIFYATPEYVARHGQPKQHANLSSHRIAFPPFENLSSEIRQWLKQNGYNYPANTHHRIDDISAIQDIALKHSAIGFNLEYSLSDLLSKGAVINLFPQHKLPSKTLHLVYRKSRYQSAHLEEFKNYILDRYA